MKILLIGNMGYIGPVVAQHLRTVLPNCSLIGFDTGYFAGSLMDPTAYPESVLDAQYFGDVRRFPPNLLNGVDAVVQLAAISNDPMGNAFEAVTESVNSLCAVEIARLAKAAGVRAFIFASSCSVYGAGGDTAKVETSELAPLTAYARSKVSTEKMLEPMASDTFTVTCLRFATACGWSPRLRLDLVLNDFVASAIASSRIEILSDGSPWRPLIHVKDMARAIEWAATRSQTSGGPFLTVNAGSDRWNYQIRDLARAVQAEIPNTTVSINSEAAPDRRSYRVDFSQFKSLAPQHQPTVDLPSAVQELFTNLRRCGFSDPNFRKSRWIRLRTLSDQIESGRLDQELNWTLAIRGG